MHSVLCSEYITHEQCMTRKCFVRPHYLSSSQAPRTALFGRPNARQGIKKCRAPDLANKCRHPFRVQTAWAQNQRNKDVHWLKNEGKEVRVATQGCHRCHKVGISQENVEILFNCRGSGCDRHVGKHASRLPRQPEVDVPQKCCRIESKTYAYCGILHTVSINYADSVEEVYVNPSS